MQLTFEGKTLDEFAIALIHAYEPPEGYYLGFSGGKDSTVIYDLAVRSGVKFDAHYNVSPIDPPEIRSFIKEHYPQIAWDYHAKGFWGRKFLAKGPPMRSPVGSRWCCKLIKEAGGRGRVKILGMRRKESSTRAKYKCYSELKNGIGWLLPIIDWTTSDVWQYIQERGLQTCSLYTEGFKRIGCILCPMLTSSQTQLQLARFPKVAELWHLACNRYFAKRQERGTPLQFPDAQAFWQWWISRKRKNEKSTPPLC